MTKILPYSTLVRQQHLNFLDHQRRQYREREDYLAGLRKSLFQIEAQMRQAEIQPLQLFKDLAHHFKVPLQFPGLGDRAGLQQFFAENVFFRLLQDFFSGRTVEECYQRILTLKETVTQPPKD